MKFYTVSNLDIKMTYIANELKSDDSWLHRIFVQTKFFADFQVKKFNLLSRDEDVRQDAYLGLWEAVVTYDYHKNFDFYRWAQWNVLKKIRDNRRKTRRFCTAKSSIKQELGSCNSAENLYGQGAMLEESYLFKQLVVDNEVGLSSIQLDVVKKNIILGKRLKEIASEYSLSIERIRQIRNCGLDKLRSELA
jgi:RNA polymerase sigma factor (sigma-70 family)